MCLRHTLAHQIRKKARQMRSRLDVMNWPKTFYWLGKISRLRMLGKTPLTRASWRSMWRVLLQECKDEWLTILHCQQRAEQRQARLSKTFTCSFPHCGTSAHPFDTVVTGLLFPSNHTMWYKYQTNFQILHFLEGGHSTHSTKGLVPFTQLVKVRRGKLVLALPSIRFSWNFYQIISGTKYE